MSYIELPILWRSGELAKLDELGIETDYDEADVKQVYLKLDEIKWFFEDKDPRFTCIALSDTEMVVNMPIFKFKNLIKSSK